MIPLAKQLPYVSSAATAVETALATAQVVKTQVIEKGVEKAQKVAVVAGQVGQLATSLPQAAASAGLAASSLAASSAARPLTQIMNPTQLGGGRQEKQTKETSYNSLEYLTLGSLAALVGGGLLVGINRGLQNYTYTGKDDSPPNAGRV